MQGAHGGRRLPCITCNAVSVSSKREQQEAAGQWLRQARERKGFATVGALARRLDVSESLVSRYETGLSAVSDERAAKIAEILELPLIEVRRNLGLWVPPAEDLDEGQAGEVMPEDQWAADLAELRRMVEELQDAPPEDVRRARQIMEIFRDQQRRAG